MALKRKPAGARERVADVVVAEQRDGRKKSPITDKRQAGTEREIHDGLRHLGTVRETAEGTFIAVVAEQLIGPFPSARSATDAVLDIVRSGAGQ